MKAYLIGAVGAVIVIAAAVALYNFRINKSSIVSEPAHIASLDQMEKVGVPEFKVAKLLENGEFDLASTKGKIVLVNFWASWCNPCVQEFPSLLKLLDKYKNDLVLVAISADENKDEATRFIKTLGVKGDNINLLWDPERKIGELYGVQRIPETYLIGRDGKLVRKIVGVEDWTIPESFEFFDSLIKH